MTPIQPREAPAPIYLADNDWLDKVRETRQKLSDICGHCLNRRVRVQTIDGHVYEGQVIGSDGRYLHLAARDTRFFGPFAAGSILTLVLYELLVITLLI